MDSDSQIRSSSIHERMQLLMHVAVSPIDNAICAYFRIVFGYFIAKWAWDYLETGIVERNYVQAKFHFTYYGFQWMETLPGNGMVYLFIGFILLGVSIALGFLFRIASLLWAIGFTYFFLLERSNYQNHYYLICLISWWLPFLPLNQRCAIDVLRHPDKVAMQTSRWVLWVLRFHFAIPYLYGGIAKITPDWMMGQPLGEMLLSKTEMPILGELFHWNGAGLAFSWGGMFFDLAIVPLLMFPTTRLPAFVLCLVFHLVNAVIFNIHIFPWLMLTTTPIFFEPEWLSRIIKRTGFIKNTNEKAIDPCASNERYQVLNSWHWATAACFGLYMTFHLVWPLRHLCFEGNPSWTERGHYFSWRMMLRGKRAVLGYAIKDHTTGKVLDGRVNDFLTQDQSEKFGRDPEMILEFGHFLAEEYRNKTGRSASVYVLALVSLNGRKPELMIDPNRDLTQIDRESTDRSWVLPQTEPLMFPPWNVPPAQWRQFIKLPELEFLKSKNQP